MDHPLQAMVQPKNAVTLEGYLCFKYVEDNGGCLLSRDAGMESRIMKRTMLKCVLLATLVLFLSSPTAVVESASDVGEISLSYDIVEKSVDDTGGISTLTVRLVVKNIGECAIDKVTAYVAETRGMAVGFDRIFFGLIESGETITSDSFEIVVETGNSQEVKRRGILWSVEYETRYGTLVVNKVPTYFEGGPE